MVRWACLLLIPLLTGCVERELVVETSEPAEVFVDGEAVGATSAASPRVVVPFEDYGTRQVTARAPGCVPARVAYELEVPWYQVFPLGLFADLLWPGTIRDEHHLHVVVERRSEPRSAREVAAEAQSYADGGVGRE